jgi:hypothetical protein
MIVNLQICAFFFSGKRGRGGDGNDRGQRAESHAVGEADRHGGRGGQHQDQNRRRYQAQVGPPAALVPVLDSAESRQQPWYKY